MQNIENCELKEQVAQYQYAADALCDLRTDVAPLIAQHIVRHEKYQSWGMVTVLGALYATDKLDGYLASKRAHLMKEATEMELQSIDADRRLVQSIQEGGRKDDKADKVLTHSIFLSIAARESLNKNLKQGILIASSDAVMYCRDKIVGKARDKAALEGKKGDARKLGKYKQGLLVLTAMAAVTPCEQRSVGRKIVAAGIIGGVALSILSGIDQVKSLQSTNVKADIE